MNISDFTQSPVKFRPKLRRCRMRKPAVFAPGMQQRKRNSPSRKLDAPAIERRGFRQEGVGTAPPVSSRKLAAGMWHLAADINTASGGRELRAGQIYRLGFQHQHLRRFPSFITNGATMTESFYSRSSTKVSYFSANKNLLQTQQDDQLLKAQARIQKLESHCRCLNKKVLYLIIKLYEERISCTRTECQKLHLLTNDLKHELSREKRNCERMKISNSKLHESLAEITLCAKEFMLSYEKERKMRILTEEICQELAKKIEEAKPEIEEIKKEFLRSQEEIEEERKMMQLAEVWREEQIQIKMFDAKLILEEKYRQMNNLIADLETFLSTKDANLRMIEMSEAEVIREAANSVRIEQDIKEFTFLPLEDHQKDKANEANEKHVNSNSSFKFCPISSKKHKNNMSALCKLWKSSLRNGEESGIKGSEKLVNGSNEYGNPHITRGIHGCVEWPQKRKKQIIQCA